jgi:LysR family transcriptional regulator, hydrogen peroxide-inducible genes activator
MIEAVTLRQLRYLVALADTLHFGRAAVRCHVSQPSLSAQIQQLEDLLGAVLVERTQRQVLLTAAGKEAVGRARRVLADMDDLGAAMRAANEPLAGRVRLGVIPTLAPFYLPLALPRLTADYPDLQLAIREDLTERLLEALRAGRLDALLLALPSGEAGLEEIPLFEEKFRAALPIGHPLCAKPDLCPGDLAGPDLLLLAEGHCLRDQALAVCGAVRRSNGEGADEAGFAASSLVTVMELAAAGLGVTLAPALAAARAPANLVLRDFADPAPGRTIGLVWRAASPRRAAWRALATALTAAADMSVALSKPLTPPA